VLLFLFFSFSKSEPNQQKPSAASFPFPAKNLGSPQRHRATEEANAFSFCAPLFVLLFLFFSFFEIGAEPTKTFCRFFSLPG